MVRAKSACWLFAWPSFIFLGLDLSAATYSFPFYPWREASRRNHDQLTFKLPEVTPIPISYRLDAWSQYDNPEEGNAREGDIRERSLFRKTTTTDESLIWPDGVVPYFVDDTIVNEPTKLGVLEDAMENIMKLTCVRFVRIYADINGNFPSHTWLNITGNEQGCFSDLGRSGFGPGNMNLDVRRCFRTKGHALHEILHTLGVFHEHMRPDRDEYIQILWDNIKEGDVFNFLIMDENAVTNYGLPYDYDSIMHYSMTAFSKDKSIPTIVPRKKNAVIGQRNHLSFYDVKKLLITYKCNDIDFEYLHHKVNHEHSDRLELLNLNTTKNSPVASFGRALDRSRSSIRNLQDSPYPMPISQQANIPNIWEPYYYDFYYPDYFPDDPSVTDIYYYYE